jgi:hypothetical protein
MSAAVVKQANNWGYFFRHGYGAQGHFAQFFFQGWAPWYENLQDQKIEKKIEPNHFIEAAKFASRGE